MRVLFGAIYWIVVGVLAVVGIYASVFGNLFPYFLLAALGLALIGVWRPGLRYSWGALVGSGGLPALVFLANIAEGVRSALNAYCGPEPATQTEDIAPKGVVVECSIIPGSYYVLFAFFAAVTLLGVALLYLQVRNHRRTDGQQTRSVTVLGTLGISAILLTIIGGIALSIMKATAPPSPSEQAGLPPNGLPVSCSEGEEEVGICNGVGDDRTPEIEMIEDEWRYVYASAGFGAFTIQALDEDGNTLSSSTVSGLAGDEGRSSRLEATDTFVLKIDADDSVGRAVLACEASELSGRNKGALGPSKRGTQTPPLNKE